MIKRERSRAKNFLRRTNPAMVVGKPQLRPQAAAKRSSKKIRYAVVGLGHIAQVAVLPAFKHAAKNSQLAALVSNDPTKLKELSRRYRVPLAVSYEGYDELLLSGHIDAVYIAEPNSLHCDFAIRAAYAGIHVLCEKPLAINEEECELIIAACKQTKVKLMTAYRLHFEKSNLEAVRLIQSGKIGTPRYFNSTFSMQAREGNYRLKKKLGGGPMFDLGVYCINAARYLFRAEPTRVTALTLSGSDKRFREVEEMAGVVLEFPEDRLATFVCSFGAADSAEYQIVGTKGSIHLKNGYEYIMPIEMTVTVDGKSKTSVFAKRDQFAPELIYFSECIQKNKAPEPSGQEGLNDVRVVQAVFKSAQSKSSIKLPSAIKKSRPTPRQEIRRAPVKKPDLVKAKPGSQD
jgi:glucose-fructose oxidoreductase